MSSYLYAFFIGPWEQIKPADAEGVKLNRRKISENSLHMGKKTVVKKIRLFTTREQKNSMQRVAADW